MRRTLRALAPVLMVGLVLLAPRPASAQCAMCKTALTNSEEGRAMSAEFNRAILLMLFAPYVLMGAAATYLVRGRIRSLAARAVARVLSPVRPTAFRG